MMGSNAFIFQNSNRPLEWASNKTKDIHTHTPTHIYIYMFIGNIIIYLYTCKYMKYTTISSFFTYIYIYKYTKQLPVGFLPITKSFLFSSKAWDPNYLMTDGADSAPLTPAVSIVSSSRRRRKPRLAAELLAETEATNREGEEKGTRMPWMKKEKLS